MQKETAAGRKKGKAGRQPSLETLERKIEKQKETLARSRKKYETDKEALALLLKEREVLRKEEVIEAITKSSRSYEEIMAFIKGKDSEK